jgi:hypothetical protein
MRRWRWFRICNKQIRWWRWFYFFRRWESENALHAKNARHAKHDNLHDNSHTNHSIDDEFNPRDFFDEMNDEDAFETLYN